MKTNKIIMAALGVALASVVMNANATVVTSGTSLTPSLTITGACAVAVSGNTAFASAPSSNAAPLTLSSVIGTVTVTGCAGGSYWLAANGGTSYGITNAGKRNLSSGVAANNIGYTLDLGGAGGTQTNWGTIGMPTVPSSPTLVSAAYHNLLASASDVYTVTGNALIPVAPVAATYTDTVAVIVEF